MKKILFALVLLVVNTKAMASPTAMNIAATIIIPETHIVRSINQSGKLTLQTGMNIVNEGSQIVIKAGNKVTYATLHVASSTIQGALAVNVIPMKSLTNSILLVNETVTKGVRLSSNIAYATTQLTLVSSNIATQGLTAAIGVYQNGLFYVYQMQQQMLSMGISLAQTQVETWFNIFSALKNGNFKNPRQDRLEAQIKQQTDLEIVLMNTIAQLQKKNNVDSEALQPLFVAVKQADDLALQLSSQLMIVDQKTIVQDIVEHVGHWFAH